MVTAIKSYLQSRYFNRRHRYHQRQMNSINYANSADEAYCLQLLWMIQRRNTPEVQQWLADQPPFKDSPPAPILSMLSTLNTICDNPYSVKQLTAITEWSTLFETMAELLSKCPPKWYAFHQHNQIVTENQIQTLTFNTSSAHSSATLTTIAHYGLFASVFAVTFSATRFVVDTIATLSQIDSNTLPLFWLIGPHFVSMIISAIFSTLLTLMLFNMAFHIKLPFSVTWPASRSSIKAWYVNWKTRKDMLTVTQYQVTLEHADYIELCVLALLLFNTQIPSSLTEYKKYLSN